MRHKKLVFKLGRTTSHRRALLANMLKSLIIHGKITTTVTKAKFLKRYADKMVTLAKTNTLASFRRAKGELMIRYNRLTPKEARAAKKGDLSAYNEDRRVLKKLFTELGPRFKDRQGGYTRLVRKHHRVGDNAPTCVLSYLPETENA